MPDWLPSLLGPGGAIISVIILGKIGFNFLIKLIEEQKVEQQKQAVLYRELHTKILEHITESTVATVLQTEVFKTLNERLLISLDR